MILLEMKKNKQAKEKKNATIFFIIEEAKENMFQNEQLKYYGFISF